MFDQKIITIRRKYAELGLDLGWRFLTCSKFNLDSHVETIFLTLNPGGNVSRNDHPAESCESGSAYVVESWSGAPPGNSKLQLQIRALFSLIDENIDGILSGQLVPFRSPSWDALPRKEECLAFGRELWTDIIELVNPNLIIAMGKTQLRPALLDILGEPTMSEDVPVGWGKIKAGLDIYPGTRIVSLPHLSRFGIVTRSESLPSLKYLFDLTET